MFSGEFVQQGNIRKDEFRELLAAELVIADNVAAALEGAGLQPRI